METEITGTLDFILLLALFSLLSMCIQVEQLHKIFKLCGSPSDDYWKKMKLPTSFRPPHHYKPSFEEFFKHFSTPSFGLLTTLLALDPTSRGSAASGLQSEVSTTRRFFFVQSILLLPIFSFFCSIWLTNSLKLNMVIKKHTRVKNQELK